MTNREFYTAVIAASVNTEVTAHATAELAKLDARNEKRKTTVSKSQAANADLTAVIVAGFEPTFIYTARQIAEKHDISTQKVSALMAKAVAEGVVSVKDFKPNGKGRTMKGYSLANSAENAE